jgi:hypothetical protein
VIETEFEIENQWRELMIEIGIFIVDKDGQMIRWIFSAFRWKVYGA